MPILKHVTGLWGPWWWLPGGFFAAYSGLMYAIGDLRIEHVLISLTVAAFAYFGPGSKRFLLDVSPYIAVGAGYDSFRYLREAWVTSPRVWSCELRQIDMMISGVSNNLTFQEWLAAQHTPFLDLLAALPYGVFFLVAFAYAGHLYFIDRHRMRVFLFAFAIANYLSYLLWILIPAAPPWYVHQYGCGVDVMIPPSAAALVRVDALLGGSYFHDFYTRAASAFGAMPSMHNAYPLLGLLTSWSVGSWRTRLLHGVYFVWMALASLYLDHHWLIDAIAGWLIAAVAIGLSRRLVVRWYGPTQGSALRAETGS